MTASNPSWQSVRTNNLTGRCSRRIALFNDTVSCPHVGCLAVSDAHNRMLAQASVSVLHRFFVHEHRTLWRGDAEASLAAVLSSPLAPKMAEVDAVVVNGEGTIHHTNGRHLLAILAAAQELRIATFLINAVMQDSETHLETLRRLHDFTVRDAFSSNYLAALGVPHRLVMDSILEAGFVSQPGHDFSGKIVITDHHHGRDQDVGRLLRQIRAELGHETIYYPLHHRGRCKDWQHAVADFSTARLVITARHHGVYLAGLAGVPFVALGSNTWKIEGTLAMFGRALSVCSRLDELRESCMRAQQDQNLFDEFRGFLQAQRPLSTLANLTQFLRHDLKLTSSQ